MKKLKLITFVSALVLTAGVVRAQDSALLDLLVKKKVITDQEAEETRAELAKEYAATPAGKINLSSPINQIRLYGDGRVRYEWREGQGNPTSAGYANADRFRYRLRIGADVKLSDEWFFGLRLETGNGARSTNVTFSQNNGTFGKEGAPFGKNNSGVFVGQAYLKYTPFTWGSIEGGKIPNPFVTTPMVWDEDINPEGFAEQFKYSFGPFGGSNDTSSYSKDGKSTVTPGEPGEMSVDVFANFGQFVYETATPQNAFGSGGRNDSWLFGWQVGAKLNLNKTTYLQAAPTLYNYSGSKGNDFAALYSGEQGLNQTGINDLLIVDVPVEFGFVVHDLPVRLFGDAAWNLNANHRASAAGHPNDGDENMAYQAGIAINKVKKKGDWELKGYWQHSEAYALDANLIDSDIFDDRLNMEGFVFKGSYAFTDAVTFAILYHHGEIINKSLGTGGQGDLGSQKLNNINLIQADVSVKF